MQLSLVLTSSRLTHIPYHWLRGVPDNKSSEHGARTCIRAEEEEALALEEPSGDAKLITAIRDPLKEATQPG
jgi:hypothetical protein